MARILIIGGGVSGLSAGIYAELKGHQAIVCEKHKITGGNLTGWQRDEYHIDNCIHWLTGTNRSTDTYKIWETLGALGNVNIFQGETLFTCEKDGKTLSLNKDLYKTQQDMLDISPDDAKEIKALIRAVEIVQGLSGIGGKDHCDRLSLIEKITKTPSLLKYINMTTGELAESFKHPLLRFFIGSLLGNDFGAIALLVVFATFCGENGGIPEGGSIEMAKRISNRFLSLGGTLLNGKEAIKINYSGKKAHSVSFSDGSEIEADYLVLTADPAAVFGKILDVPMPQQLKKLYDDPRLQRFSSFHCAFSCDLSLLPFRGDFVFSISEPYQKALRTNTLVLREFSHEKGFSPEGKTVLQALCFCKEDFAKEFINLREESRKDYLKIKQNIAEIFKKLIIAKIPQLSDSLRLIDVWTPASYRRFTNSEAGTFMSFTLPSKCLPIRKSNRIAGLSNVILATQWQQIPGGLPIAAEGGRLAIETINKLEEKVLSRKTVKRNIVPDEAKAR